MPFFKERNWRDFQRMRVDDSYLVCTPDDKWNPVDDIAEQYYHEAQSGLWDNMRVDHWPLSFAQQAPRYNPFADDPLTLHVNVFHQEADVARQWCQSCGARLHNLPEYARMVMRGNAGPGVLLGAIEGPKDYHSLDNSEHLTVSPLDLLWKENEPIVRKLALEAAEKAARANWTKHLW